MTEESPPMQALRRAKQNLEAMRQSTSVEELAEHWIDLLQSLRRCWNKANHFYFESARGRQLKPTYLSRVLNEPLPRYLWHARNADEHGIAELTHARPTRGGIRGVGLVQEVRFVNGKVTTFVGDPSVEVFFELGGVLARAVVDRGEEYAPPVPPSGLPHVLELAESGVSYFEALLEEIEPAVVRSGK